MERKEWRIGRLFDTFEKRIRGEGDLIILPAYTLLIGEGNMLLGEEYEREKWKGETMGTRENKTGRKGKLYHSYCLREYMYISNTFWGGLLLNDGQSVGGAEYEETIVKTEQNIERKGNSISFPCPYTHQFYGKRICCKVKNS